MEAINKEPGGFLMISKNDSFLSSLARDELISLEELLKKELSKGNPFIVKEVLRLLNSGGKRIRPLLTILFSMLGETYDSKQALLGAAALETMHMATLVHDDTIDNSAKRRGIDTTFQKHGTHTAIYTGDWLLVKSLQILSATNDETAIKSELLNMLSQAMESVCSGEIDQYYARGTIPGTDKYFSRIKGKTAALFVAASVFGATISRLTEPQIKIAAGFGENFGIAFQILDDIIDIESSYQIAGKPVKNDLNEGIITLPVILACKKSGEFKLKVAKYLNDPDISLLSEIRDFSISLGGVDSAYKICRKHVKACLDLLDKLPDANAKTDIEQVVRSVFKSVL
jgi:heptaprenyl diphosphate synthase